MKLVLDLILPRGSGPYIERKGTGTFRRFIHQCESKLMDIREVRQNPCAAFQFS